MWLYVVQFDFRSEVLLYVSRSESQGSALRFTFCEFSNDESSSAYTILSKIQASEGIQRIQGGWYQQRQSRYCQVHRVWRWFQQREEGQKHRQIGKVIILRTEGEPDSEDESDFPDKETYIPPHITKYSIESEFEFDSSSSEESEVYPW